MGKKYIFVANWKMYLSYDQALALVTDHYDGFIELSERSGHEIVLCPSLLALSTIKKMFKTKNKKKDVINNGIPK